MRTTWFDDHIDEKLTVTKRRWFSLRYPSVYVYIYIYIYREREREIVIFQSSEFLTAKSWFMWNRFLKTLRKVFILNCYKSWIHLTFIFLLFIIVKHVNLFTYHCRQYLRKLSWILKRELFNDVLPRRSVEQRLKIFNRNMSILLTGFFDLEQ